MRIGNFAIVALVLGLGMCWGVAAAQGQTAPATVARPLTRTMEFRFENASVDSILEDISVRLGFVIEESGPIAARVTVMAPRPVNADESVSLLNTVLVSVGYSAVEQPERQNADGSTTRVLRVMTFAEAEKVAPVSY